MVKAIKAALPMVKTVDAYDVTRKGTIKTPAVLLEALEMKPGRRVTGRRTPAHGGVLRPLCPVGENRQRGVGGAQLRRPPDARDRRQHLGVRRVRRTPDRLTSAFPGVFNPDEKGFESWVIGWEQTLHLGEVWEEADFLPHDVVIGGGDG